jgi:nucleolar protein 56
LSINTWFGVLEPGSKGELFASELFPKNIRELALHSLSLRDSRQNIPPEGFDLATAAIECGFVDSFSEYYSLLHEVTLETVKLQVSEALTPDQRIIQAVEALDNINETTNSLSERLFEWYGGYFPESGLSGEALALFVAKYGSRENIPLENPLYLKSRDSMGAKLEAADELLLKGFAESVCSLYERRKQIEAYIESSMETLAPNLTMLAGPMLGARLISIAGSLEKLASFPSSTIQVIGASKALFKHLRSRAPSPKHGIIGSGEKSREPLQQNCPLLQEWTFILQKKTLHLQVNWKKRSGRSGKQTPGLLKSGRKSGQNQKRRGGSKCLK